MPLNILFALFIGLTIGWVIFGFWGGVIVAIAASLVVTYWDKIDSWLHTQMDKWDAQH